MYENSNLIVHSLHDLGPASIPHINSLHLTDKTSVHHRLQELTENLNESLRGGIETMLEAIAINPARSILYYAILIVSNNGSKLGFFVNYVIPNIGMKASGFLPIKIQKCFVKLVRNVFSNAYILEYWHIKMRDFCKNHFTAIIQRYRLILYHWDQ